MNICIVTHVIRLTDGQGRVNYEIARHLVRQGHHVTLVSTALDPALAAETNIQWCEVPIPSWLTLDLLRYQVFAFGASRILRKKQRIFDVVHLNGAITYINADVNACHFVHSDWLKSKYHTARVTQGLYSIYQWCVTLYNSWWEKIVYNSSYRVVAVSDAVRESLIREANVTPAKIEVIYNGVDTSEFHPRNREQTNMLRDELGVPAEAFLVLFSGGIKTRRKNLDLLLQSIAELGQNYHLVVAGTDGGGPYPAMADELRIAHQVHFLGHRDDMPSLMRESDAFAFPSHYDPFALVVLEAMASGIPVITVPSVGASAVIKNSVNGFVLRDGDDLAGMVTALRRLSSDHNYAHRIGRAARETAEMLRWETMAQHYEQLYKEVLLRKQNFRENPVSQVVFRTRP